MAKQVGIIRIKGTIDGLTFYQSVFGDLVRTKGGVSRKRFKKDPVFERARENSNEFGTASKCRKLFRIELRELMINASDPLADTHLNYFATAYGILIVITVVKIKSYLS